MARRITIRSGVILTDVVVLLLFAACHAIGQDDASAAKNIVAISISDRVPYGREPVDYFGMAADDAVARLRSRFESGDAKLAAHPRFGYLLSVLELLDVPLESQLLVYSKTARAPALVSPKNPRAIFFNDEVSVAWIPGSRELELTAVDPVKGVTCYTLSQPLDSSDGDESRNTSPTEDTVGLEAASFQRRLGCLACHAARSSLEVPGLLLRAFQTDETGKPLVGFSRVTHDMTFGRRWGGWYVTGSPQGLVHRGNLVGESEDARHKSEPGFASSLSVLDEKFDVDGYPFSKSDLVAHLVLAHQAHGTNLLIRVALEARLNRRSDAESQLLRYFVFADEPPLELSQASAAALLKNSEFAASFQKRGPTDNNGRSLRDFSMEDGVFKHRLSYLIHSRIFDELPADCRTRLLTKLWDGLTSTSVDDGFTHLEDEERLSIVAIVRATVPRLPGCWSELRAAERE